MDIALHRNHDFRAGKRVVNRSPATGLRLVPFAIRLRQRMNVVRRRIAIRNVHRLAGLYAEYMRLIDAAFLIQMHGCRGRLELSVEAALYPNEGVL